MCKCEIPGWCKCLNRDLSGRLWELYNNINCTQKQHDKYVQLFNQVADSGLPSVSPNFMSMIGSFVSSNINYIFNGQRLPEPLAKERLDICAECEYKLPKDDQDQKNWTCQECGCFLRQTPIYSPGKAFMSSEFCPKDKWPKLSLEMIQAHKPTGGCGGCQG